VQDRTSLARLHTARGKALRGLASRVLLEKPPRTSRKQSGLYLDPPDRALVLCVDEKSQIQALDRTQEFRGPILACEAVT
jgi:hypothetical protein